MTTPPQSLVRFGDELVRAIAHEQQAPRRRRRRRALQATAAGAVAALAVAGAVSLPGDGTSIVGPSAVATASAAERASAVLDPPPGHVVHAVVAYRQVAAGGGASTWREETWRSTSAPYARRSLTTAPGGARLETSTGSGHGAALYDAATDTIYTNPPASGPALGTPEPAQDGDPLREQLVRLLRSGDARPVARSTVDGRDAIRFRYDNAVPGGGAVRWTYLVDARSYAPLRITTTSPDGSRTTARFRTYETLGDGASATRLLSVREQHPGAAVDTSEAGYRAARARLQAPTP